jgi:hypothetical protein
MPGRGSRRSLAEGCGLEARPRWRFLVTTVLGQRSLAQVKIPAKRRHLSELLIEFMDEVVRVGYALRRRWRSAINTLAVARELGAVVDIPALLRSGGIETVQSLRPLPTNEGRDSHYSGTFGLGRYPLHTDLANWAIPPRYFLLRCIVGAKGVETLLLRNSWLVDRLGRELVRRAILRPRKAGRYGSNSLLPVANIGEDSSALRWDPLFLIPVNSEARVIASTMASNASFSDSGRVELHDPGDTLVVDNWRMFHGRSAVTCSALHRNLERVYISALNYD